MGRSFSFRLDLKAKALEAMKAIRIHTYGGPEVLKYEDVPFPKLRHGEVLIRVYAAGVNPVDWQVREGYLKDMPGKIVLRVADGT